jgi:hypothetical protein
MRTPYDDVITYHVGEHTTAVTITLHVQVQPQRLPQIFHQLKDSLKAVIYVLSL